MDLARVVASRAVLARAATARTLAPVVWACSICISAAPAAPVEDLPLEYQVKAAYLYNFMRFVTWPVHALPRNGKFNLCVVGADRFGRALETLAGELVEGRPITVHKLANVADSRGAQCQLLFAAGADWGPSIESEAGLLTVGESLGFLERGGVINLVEVRGRIRFEVNQDAAKRAGLTLSSRLLRLAMERR